MDGNGTTLGIIEFLRGMVIKIHPGHMGVDIGRFFDRVNESAKKSASDSSSTECAELKICKELQ